MTDDPARATSQNDDGDRDEDDEPLRADDSDPVIIPEAIAVMR